MAPGAGRGAYTYKLGAGGASYSLTGRLVSGAFTVTGGTPDWLADERTSAASDLRDAQQAAATAQADAAAARHERDMAQAELGTTQAALTAAQSAPSDAQAELATVQSELAGAEAELVDTPAGATELGARLIKGYIEQYGMLNNGWPPRWADVRKTRAVGEMFGYWPDNPYTGQPMAPGSDPGYFDYAERSAGVYELRICRSPSSWVDLSGTVPQQLKSSLNAARDERIKVDMYYLQAAIDRYAVANNGQLPYVADETELSPWALDYWPTNPWLSGVRMGPGADPGSYTYSPTGPNWYALSGHLSDGTDYTVDGIWTEWLVGFRDNLKDKCVQAHGQVLKDYIEEWKATHGGTPPTVIEMTKEGAVGASHGWWPLSPWTTTPMVNADTAGDFQYTPGAGETYALTVRQKVTDVTQEYYTPE